MAIYKINRLITVEECPWLKNNIDSGVSIEWYELVFQDSPNVIVAMKDGSLVEIPIDSFGQKEEIQFLAHKMRLLSEEQRRELFSMFCKECGSDDPKCQCWNDD